MKYVLSVVVTISAFCYRAGLSEDLQNYFPDKFDVIKVRNEYEMQAHKGRHAALDFIGLVERHFGYSAEEHQVTTWDGYNLKLHRISGSPHYPKAFGKPVVFFQHCMFSSSDSYVMIGPHHDLAYMLADTGYDVWFVNGRGNTYSRSHVTMDPNTNKTFWDFSWHEIGTIDVPTSIDYVLQSTGQNRLTFIGFSMGTTISYVLLSKLPEYNEKINVVISLSPIAFWANKPLLMKLGIDRIEIMKVVKLIKYYPKLI